MHVYSARSACPCTLKVHLAYTDPDISEATPFFGYHTIETEHTTSKSSPLDCIRVHVVQDRSILVSEGKRLQRSSNRQFRIPMPKEIIDQLLTLRFSRCILARSRSPTVRLFYIPRVCNFYKLSKGNVCTFAGKHLTHMRLCTRSCSRVQYFPRSYHSWTAVH